VNLSQFARWWVGADLAVWQAYEGRERFHLSNPQHSRVLCTYHCCFTVCPCDWLS
jgi:hypothetical protein